MLMTEKEKMLAGELYDPADEDISNEQLAWLSKLWEFNQLRPDQIEEIRAYMQEVFAECGGSRSCRVALRGKPLAV